jgi:hypothetical protein
MSARVITILGMGMSALRKADAIEQFVQGSEVWSLNNAYLIFPALRGKFARYFEIHKWEYLRNWSPGTHEGAQVDHFAMLAQQGCPVYSAGQLPLVENQVVYPFADVVRHFGPSAEFKGSPSWMIALALYEHDCGIGERVSEIRSFGIDQLDPSHLSQRAAWAQWIVRAEFRGIKISGTAAAFRNEPETDAGLQGLVEYYRNEINMKGK